MQLVHKSLIPDRLKVEDNFIDCRWLSRPYPPKDRISYIPSLFRADVSTPAFTGVAAPLFAPNSDLGAVEPPNASCSVPPLAPKSDLGAGEPPNGDAVAALGPPRLNAGEGEGALSPVGVSGSMSMR